MKMEYFKDCCSTIFSSLPQADLPFIQALILGTLFSFFIIALMHQRYHKTTLKNSVIQLFKDMFISIPEADHSEFMKCDRETCVRCQKSQDLKKTIITVWDEMKDIRQNKEYSRIASGIAKLKNKNYVEEGDSKATIFSMDLQMKPVAHWTSYDCYNIERDLLDINFSIIKEEFNQLFKHFQNGTTDGWKLNHIPEGHWCTFPIIDQGFVNDENCLKCPNTSALLGSLPSIMKDCVFGNACFSLVFSNSYIEPHYGPTNTRLRCHLGLQVPEDCWLEVNGVQIQWKEGKCIIFDDSLEHSVFYGSNKLEAEPRAILLLDFWHPNISAKEKNVLLQLFKPEHF